jgi:hypothetical protein
MAATILAIALAVFIEEMNAAASSTVNACFRLVGRYLDLEHPGALQAQNSHPPLRVSFDDIHGNSALHAAAGTWEGPNIPVAHISTYVVPDEASNAGEYRKDVSWNICSAGLRWLTDAPVCSCRAGSRAPPDQRPVLALRAC